MFLKPLVLFLSLLAIPDLPETVSWQTDMDKARELAREEQKNILVYFTGSDWCAPCIQLKTDLFQTQEFAELSEQYILVYIDVPRNKDLLSPAQHAHNKKVMDQLNKRKVFPLFTVLKTNGKFKDEYSGYAMNGDVSYHLNFLKKNQ